MIESKTDRVFFVESNFNIDFIKSKIRKNDIIISFDYVSHNKLKKYNIAHTNSDNFLEENDYDLIQKKSYEVSKWYELKEIKEKIEYEGINLGELYFIEFHYYVLPIIKKFLEVKRIYEEYNLKKYYATSKLKKIVNIFSECEIIQEEDIGNKFLGEQISYNFNNLFSINISKKRYSQIKNISEKFFNLIIKNKIKKNNKILLIEFDTIKYEKILHKSKKYPFEIILFNRRRPYIWNLESFRIIKKNKIPTIFDQFFISNNLKNEFKNLKKLYINNIKNFNLEEFFSIYNKSFWKVIEESFFELLEKRIDEAITEINLAKQIMKKLNPSIVVVWSESGFNEQIIIKISKQYKIPIILLQHGVYNDGEGSFEFNLFSGNIPIYSDNFVSWGETIKEYLENNQINKKIYPIGSPAYDKLFSKNITDNNFILLAISPPRKMHVSGYKISHVEEYKFMIEKIIEIVNKINFKLVIKTHPFPYEPYIIDNIEKKFTNIEIVRTGDISNLIKNCSVFLSLSISSTILESQILNKPSLSIQTNYDVWGGPIIIRDNLCKKIQIDQLEIELKKILSDKSSKDENLLLAKKSLNRYLVNHGRATEEFLKLLDDILNKNE